MSAGLRRYLRPEARPQQPPAAGAGQAGGRCELCSVPIGDDHDHVVNLEARNLLCACRPCCLLFTQAGAARGRYRAVPDRYLRDPDFALSEAQWDALQIPVGMAFLFHNSSLGRTVALYPSPIGATESLLPLGTWDEVLRANPGLADVEPDVEALLLRRRQDGFECFLVPIGACYELVALVRLHWQGFEGGAEAWAAIDAFFDRLRARSRPVAGEPAPSPGGDRP
jgi:hypothetical protein